MNKDIIIGFVLGLAAGAALVYIPAKKYREKADEEVNEMRKYNLEVKRQGGHTGSESDSTDETTDTPRKGFRRASGGSMTSVEAQNELKQELIKNKYNYSTLSEDDEDEGGGETAMPKKTLIYVITPDEYDADQEHSKSCLTWYPLQDILADEDDKKMSPENIGGHSMLESDFEDDTKYVRNDMLMIDFEIVRDEQNTWEDPEA